MTWLFSQSPVVIALQVAAGLLMLWARITFGQRSFHAAANPRESGLVTHGLYRFLRHPIYSCEESSLRVQYPEDATRAARTAPVVPKLL